MDKQKFLDKMVELMDTETKIDMDTKLEGIEEWDSLSYVAFLAMCASISDKKIQPTDVKEAITIGDLYKLLEG